MFFSLIFPKSIQGNLCLWLCATYSIFAFIVAGCVGRDYKPRLDALIDAVKHGHLELVEKLLDQGVKIDTVDKENKTALEYAAMKGNKEMIQCLLKRKTQLRKQSLNKSLEIAIHNKNMEIQQLLQQALTVEPSSNGGGGASSNGDGGASSNGDGGASSNGGGGASGNGGGGASGNGGRKNANTDNDDYSDYPDKNLIDAILANDISMVTKVLLNKQDNNGRTALIHAIKKGDFEVINALLNNGADINIRDNNGKTALIHATTRTRECDSEKVLLNKSINQWCYRPNAASIYATEKDNLKMVNILLSNRADVNKRDCNGKTALIHATERADSDIAFEIFNALLNNGSDINIQDDKGKTALMYAAKYKDDLKIINALLNKNVNEKNVNLRCYRRKTALTYAIEYNNLAFVKALLDKGADIISNNEQVLIDAILSSNLEIVNILLDKEAVKNRVNLYFCVSGKTALIYAILRSNLEIVNALLEKGGANVNLKDNNTRKTPLMHAVKTANLGIINALLNKKPDVNEKDSFGNTALSHAYGLYIDDNSESIIQLLLENVAI